MPIYDVPFRRSMQYEYVSFSRLQAMVHMAHRDLFCLLGREDVLVFRAPFGRRVAHFVQKKDAASLVARYGTDAARKRRRERMPLSIRLKRPPVSRKCRRCGKEGKQWRATCLPKGKRRVYCGHCGRTYTLGRIPALVSTCPRCGAEARQVRGRMTSAGKRRVHCMMCGKWYTLPGAPHTDALDVPIISHGPALGLVEW